MRRYIIFFLLSVCLWTVNGGEIFVRYGATGNGSSSNPFGSIQQALNAASSGDIITLYNGTYTGPNNTILSLGSLSSITIRGFDDNPASTIIRWTDVSVRPWINMTGSPMVSVRGIGFYDRRLDTMPETIGTTYLIPALFYMLSGVLKVDRCRFENHVTVSLEGTEVVYIDIRKNSTAYVSNSVFLNGWGYKGISVDTGSVLVDSCIFVNHSIGTGGTCVGTRLTGDQGTPNATIINSIFVNASTPVRFYRGGGRVIGNSFYNCINSVQCPSNVLFDIQGSGNKFCGSNYTNFCVLVSAQNVRPPDACGVCDGSNQFKDCNGVCFGSAYGAACTPKKSIYVSPTGTGDGSSISSPLSNISQAIDLANYGDSVKLLPGNYSISNISTRGKQGITIRSESGNPFDVTLTCVSPYLPTAFSFADKESFDTEIQGMTLTQCATDWSIAGAIPPIIIGADTGVTFRNMRFVFNGNLLSRGVIGLNDSYVRVFDSTFANNTGERGAAVYGKASNSNRTCSFYAKNSRFLNHFVSDRGGVIFFQLGMVDVSESYFSNNDAYVEAAEIYTTESFISWVNNTISLSGPSAGTPKTMYCSANRGDSIQYGNVYCGTPRPNNLLCSPLFNSTNQTTIPGGVPDACGVCNGNNACIPPPSPSPSAVPSSSPSPIPSSSPSPTPSASPSSSVAPSSSPSATPSVTPSVTPPL